MLTAQLLSFLTHVAVALIGIFAIASLYVSLSFWSRRRTPPTDASNR